MLWLRYPEQNTLKLISSYSIQCIIPQKLFLRKPFKYIYFIATAQSTYYVFFINENTEGPPTSLHGIPIGFLSLKSHINKSN